MGFFYKLNLNTDSVFRRSPELFYLQMLLDPLEEKLNLPPVMIEFRDNYWVDRQRPKDVDVMKALEVAVPRSKM